MSDQSKTNVNRSRFIALEARTLFDGSAIFDASLMLDADDGSDVTAPDSLSQSAEFENAANAAVSAIESTILTANREDVFAQFSGGLDSQTDKWNAALDQLQSDMADGNVAVGIAFVSASALDGENALYVAEGQDGNPAIHLNSDWVQNEASSEELQSSISDKLSEFVNDRLTPETREVYFIDGSLTDVQTLIDAVPTDAEVYVVQAGVDGFAFMAETLEGMSGVDAIHVLGHGAVGEAQLGSVTLSDSNLDSYSAQLSVIGQALTAEGDILLYGCNVADTGEGEAFIEQIASFTQADVAASDDVTGAGGDWELEVNAGSIETNELQVDDYEGQLAGLEFADLSTWSAVDGSSRAEWVLMEGNRTVFQTYNTYGKYLSSNTYEDTILRSTIKQTDTTYTINGSNYRTNYAGDNDQIGYVLGYQDSSNYVLIEWKGSDSGSSAGVYLKQYTNGSYTTLASKTGRYENWPKETLLNFEILYMDNAVKVTVNGVEKINYSGSSNQFAKGRVGFWMNSQGGVEYGNVQVAPGSLTQVVPTLQDDTYGTNTNTVLNVDKFSGLLANDYDANLDQFDILVNSTRLTSDSASTTFSTSNGSVTVYGDGHFKYTPNTGYNGSDTFTYQLIDNDGTSNSATVTISTLAPNLAPTDISADANTVSTSAATDDVVANLTVTDPNTGDSHDVLLVDQTVTGMFKVVDGVLKVADPASITSGAVYSVKLRATDLRGLSYTETLTFTAALDTDGDGVADSTDIDDDNDGILDVNEESFQWAKFSSITGSTARGTISSVGFTYTLTDLNNNPINIQTTTGMYQHSDFPAEYDVPNDDPTIKNTQASRNTLTFDSTILNPVLVFSSIGNPTTPVGINFGDDVEVLWYQKYTSSSSGAVAQSSGYTTNSITSTEGDLIVKFNGAYDTISFDYTANETYVNFAFGADFQDTDGDGVVDSLDADSDGDGVSDNVEAQLPGQSGNTVADGDQITVGTTTYTYTAPTGNDSDGDGLDDAYDDASSSGLAAIDSNSNTIADYLTDEAPTLAVGTLNSHDGTSADLVFVAPNLTLGDVENNDQISEAKVQLDNLKDGDKLSFVNSGAIRGAYDATKGILTLSGTASIAEYQAALRAVKFSSTSGDSTDRIFSFTIGSAIPFSGNGHFYEFVEAKDISWSDAKAAAEARALYGMQGYLATITSAEENDFVAAKLAGNGWIGASDAGAEGVWKWVTGPEAGTQFSSGSNAVNGQYENWASGEPNDYKFGGQVPEGEEYIHFWGDGANKGTWNDFPNAVVPGFGLSIAGYIVEYGGMPGEVASKITDSATMVVNDAPVVVGSANAGAVDVDGSNNGYLTANASLLNNLTEFTISFSVKPEAFNSGNMSLVGQNDAFEIFLKDNGNTIEFWNPLTRLNFDVSSVIALNEWTNITFTGSDVTGGASGDVKLYINGVEYASDTTGTISNYGSSSDPLTVGGRVQNGVGGLDYFNAEFDEITIWNVKKSAAEIAQIQADDLGAKTGLLHYWKLDESTGSSAVNAVSGGANLTLASGATFLGSTSRVVSTTYTEDGAAVALAPALVVSDVDDTTLNSATVKIASNAAAGDQLALTATSNIGNITASTYDSSTHTLTLSSSGGTATVAEWQTALRSIKYSGGDAQPVVTKTIVWNVSDASLTSSDFESKLVIAPKNDAPTIVAGSSTTSGSLTEADGTNSGTKELNATGVITIEDVDLGDSVTLSEVFNNDMVWSGGTLTSSQLTSAQISELVDGFVLSNTQSANKLTIDPATNKAAGIWTYSTTVDLNFLASNETLKFSYNVKATDAEDTDSTPQKVEITLNGAQEPMNVSNVSVLESDAYATFVINNTSSRTIALDLMDRTATGGDGTDTTSGNDDYNRTFEYSLDGGSTWTTYTKAFTTSSSVNTVQVRVDITDDTFPDSGELFDLNVYEVSSTLGLPTTKTYDVDSGTMKVTGLLANKVSGTDNAQGSEYRANDVFTASNGDKVDALITILSKDANVGDFVLDYDDFEPNRFSPRFSSTNGQDAEVTFKIAFVADGTNTPVALSNFYVTGLDVDGSGSDREYAILEGVSSYLVEPDGQGVKANFVNNNTVSFSGTKSLSDFHADTSYQANYEIPKSEFKITLGTSYTSQRYFYVSVGAAEATFSSIATPVVAKDALTATATIVEPPAGLKIYDATVNEGAGTISFRVARADSEGAATVDYTVTADTSTVGANTTSDVYGVLTDGVLKGTVSFADGIATQYITLNVSNDAIFEGRESFNIELSNLSSRLTLDSAADAKAVGTIVDDGSGGGADNDDRPTFSVNDVTVNESASTLTFTVSKTGDVAQGTTSSVFYSLQNKTATAGEDYTTDSGWLSFSNGEKAKSVTVTLTNDNVYEGAEQFYINLSQASNATIADSQGLATIRDDGTSNGSLAASDDDRPVFSVNSVTVNEDAGTAVFTVTKTGKTELASSVDFFTSNLAGGATAGSDYTAISSGSPTTLTFEKDETTQTIEVSILDDTSYERSESFQVNLATATGGAISVANGTGLGTIKDDGTGGATSGGSGTGTDDDRPVFSINDVSVSEGAGTIQFTVSLTGTTSQDATINYEVLADSAGTSDYSANNPQALAGTLTFYAGQSQSQTITLNVTQDDIYEISESFNIKLSSPTQSLLSATDDIGTGTIWDNGTSDGSTAAGDNDLPDVSINDVTVSETDGTIVFTITRDKASDYATTFDYAVTARTAQVGDYLANDALKGTLTIAAGSAGSTSSITLNIVDDTLFERNEVFDVKLSNAQKASIADGEAIGTIYDDDEPSGSFMMNGVKVNESSDYAVFEVLPPLGSSTYNLQFSIANVDTSLTSTNLISYKLGSNAWVSSSTLTSYSAGDRLLVRVDITDEQELALDTNESFELTVTYGTGTLDFVKATGTVVDDGSGVIFDNTSGEIDPTATLDDDRTVFSINDVSVSEGGVASFTVSRGNESDAAVSTAQTVNFATSIAGSDNSESNDFTSGSGTLTFAAGQTSKTITVQTTSDDIYEGDETFTVSLSNNTVGSRIDDAVGVATIQDDGTGADNDKPTLSISDPSIEEGSTLNFALTLDKATEADLEVRFALENVGTFDAADYSAMTVSYSGGTLQPNSVTGLYTIPAGVKSFTVSVVTTEDTVFEGPETVKLRAYVTDSAVTDIDVGTGTVNDNGSGPDGDDAGSVVDDDRPVFTVNDVSVTELDGTLTFTVTKTGSTNLSSTVAYSFSDGTATGGAASDYVGTAGTLTFAAGETEKVVNVTINDDAGEPVWEDTERFTINLATATNAVIGDAEGVGSITDQEDRTVQVSGVGPINENSTYAVFEVEAIGGGFNDLTFTVFNATANLIDVAGKPDATVSYIAPAGGNKFYVGVTIANEDDNNYEGIENFGLRASFTDDTSITDSGYNLIVDDGTGVRYDYANVPALGDSLNLYELDNDLTGIDSGGRPQSSPESETTSEVVVQKVIIDNADAFKEVKENLDAYGLADAIASEAQAQIDKLSGKIALYVLPAVEDARSDTVSLFRRLASDEGNIFMGSSAVRSSIAFDSLAPLSELSKSLAEDEEVSPEDDAFGGDLVKSESNESADSVGEHSLVADKPLDESEHKDFTAQLLAAANSNYGAGIARVSAQQLISAEPANTNLKDSNS